MKFAPKDYSVVFLSYDEPNCEENYNHLLNLNPQTLRVHGVKGSDTAHKECAKLAQTDSVIIVDGDNFVKPEFFNTSLDLPINNLQTKVLSFSAYNTINGNSYGNGGIKVWPVSLLNSMRTHENGSGVDFDMTTYSELDIVASDIRFASDYQAFRAGFREGVKLLLENNLPKALTQIDYRNFDRLWMWSHVGADMPHGEHAIYGARLAINWMLTQTFDYNNIIDFESIEDYYTGSVADSNQLFHLVRTETNNWLLGDVLSVEDSRHYRLEHVAPYRTKDNLDTAFKSWAHYFQLGTKLTNANEANKMQILARSQPFGLYKFDGISMGKEHRLQHSNNSAMLSKIYDYGWLKEQYDRLYTDTV